MYGICLVWGECGSFYNHNIGSFHLKQLTVRPNIVPYVERWPLELRPQDQERGVPKAKDRIVKIIDMSWSE